MIFASAHPDDAKRRDIGRQAYGKGREDDMPDDGERELDARKQNGIEIHEAASSESVAVRYWRCDYRVSRSFCRGCRGRQLCTALGDLFFEPKAVVLFSPVQVDTARAHRFERALHAQGSDVDVTDDERDEQNRNDGVNPLGNLHAEDVGHVEWKQLEIA